MLSVPIQAQAFGSNAHLIVGYIAEERICASTRRAIAPLLEGDSLAEAGLWADKIRGYSQWDYAKPWHYLNVPDGVAIADASRNPQGDVLAAIGEMDQRLADATLENLSDEERGQAFHFLVHFVADIHQPLHVGRRNDLGGNRVRVAYKPASSKPASGKQWKKTNLHKYWDSVALNMAVVDPQAYAANLIAYMQLDMSGWRPGKPSEWATESLLYRAEVYDFPAAEGGVPVRLDAAYQARTLEILDKRLLLAGLRLAAVLDRHYCIAKEAETPGSKGLN